MAIVRIDKEGTIDVGIGSIEYQEGRLDTLLFNDWSIELRDGFYNVWNGTDLVSVVNPDNMSSLTSTEKQWVKDAINAVRNATIPYNYVFGISGQVEVDWFDPIFDLSVSADIYMMGSYSYDHTAPFKKFAFTSEIDSDEVEEGFRVFVI